MERYDKFWAGYLGVTLAELNESGTSIEQSFQLTPSRGAIA
jgi:hypothetical protein